MAFQLTAKTRSILNQIEKNPSVVLDIENIEFIYSSSVVLKRVLYDDGSFFDSGINWDSASPSDEFLSYINLKESTNVITQSIYPDKEGSSSITSVQFSIIDKNGSVSKAFSQNTIGEILGKKAEALLGFVGGIYPADFMPIMNGIIVDFYYSAGAVNLTISHADSLRKQSLLTSSSTKLTAAIDNSTLSIPVVDSTGLVQESTGFTNYVKIDDEIIDIEVSGVGLGGGLSGFIARQRGALGTQSVPHEIDAEVKFVYTIEGKPLDIAQRIMMSSNGVFNEFVSDFQVTSQQQSGSTFIDNAVFINHPNIERASGLVRGDRIRYLVDNSFVEYNIISFGVLESGFSYFIVDANIETIVDIETDLIFSSQYNTLNFGLGMFPFEVDNAEIDRIKSTFSPNFVDMKFYIEDGIESARDFLNKQLAFAAGCVFIPRNARTSVTFLSPPLSSEALPILNENTVMNLIDLKPIRSINKFYYNDILFKYRKSVLDGEFKTFVEFLDSDSVDQFGVGVKQLSIESDGYEDNTQTTQIINRLSGRFLDRYNQAATLIKGVKMPFKYGFNIQVGDVVLFGGNGVKIADYNTGKIELPIEKYEVINQKIDLTGTVSLDILSTGYAIQGTFATFSPSSLVDTATTTAIKVKRINQADGFDFERDKYNDLIGARMRVRSSDFLYDELTTITALDAQDRNTLIIEALPTAPLSDYIIELANYKDQPDYGTSDAIDAMKQRYSFTMPQLTVTAVTSNIEFDVSSVVDLYVGAKISIHNPDFALGDDIATITDITGSTITIDVSPGFAVAIGDVVETLNNIDGFDGYLFL